MENRYGDTIEITSDKTKGLAESIVKLLIDKKLTLSLAESCTGGMLSEKLVSVPGVSAVYKAGFITYSNEAKQKLLQVSEDTLANYGAVSKETAYEMVQGALQAADSDLAAAVTGIAGPDGGTKEKPVGLVYIACGGQNKITVKRFLFQGNRQQIREKSTENAFLMLKEAILEDKNGE